MPSGMSRINIALLCGFITPAQQQDDMLTS
jgi:hypothetical protein